MEIRFSHVVAGFIGMLLLMSWIFMFAIGWNAAPEITHTYETKEVMNTKEIVNAPVQVTVDSEPGECLLINGHKTENCK